VGWSLFRRNKQAKPLVPGRDRASASSKRQVYSYYSARPASNNRPAANKQGRGDKGHAKQQRLPRPSVYALVLGVCTILVLFSLGKVLIVSPESKIVVANSGENATIDTTQLYQTEADNLLGSSVLNRFKPTIDTNGIAADLQKQFPELSSVIISIPILGNRPVIYVSPTPATFTLETPRGYYSMDAKGYILQKLPNQDTSLILIKDTTNRTPEPGAQYLATSITTFANTVNFELEQGGIGTVDYLDLPVSAPYELVAHLKGKSFYIRFNLRADATQQGGAVIATLKYLGGKTPSSYIDARTPERIYYR